METKNVYIIIVLCFGVFLLLIGTWYYGASGFESQKNITSFNSCIQAGNPVMESYPRKCRAKNGQTFTEHIGNVLQKTDYIQLEYPQPSTSVKSPLTITGKARGMWFFEANFPVVVANWDGLIIGQGYAEAQTDWMTEDFVPFKATITFEKPDYKNNGTLILQKANPSGLPEHDNALEIPILFD